MGGRGTGLDRGSSKFGTAGGGETVIEGYGAAEQALARKLFGKNMSADDIATMAGASVFKGAEIEVGINSMGRLQVDIAHKYIDTTDGMTRTFFKDSKGKLMIDNEGFFLTKAAQGQGIGRESFRTQVQAAKDNGVKNITTYALRNELAAKPAIGWKVWADFGYDAPVGDAVTRAWNGRNPLAKFDGKQAPRTIRELYGTKGGRDLWIQYGGSTRMNFSLTRGSKSIKAFNAYLKERKLPLIK